MRWRCIGLAQDHDPGSRVDFFVIDGARACRVGSVARGQLAALRALDGDGVLRIEPEAVHLVVPAAQREAALEAINRRLRDDGLIRGWRDERYAVVERLGAAPLASIERAAARFWGTLCLAAHCNGYVARADGRPERMWLARRSMSKATDPGLLDNLVGGGVPFGQAPFEALVREGAEEAGLDAATMRRAVAGRVIEVMRDVPEGLQHECIVVYDLALAPDARPVNRDGEVQEFRQVAVAEALDLAAPAREMTVDAALVTMDFALRWRLLSEDEHAAVEQAATAVLGLAGQPGKSPGAGTRSGWAGLH